MSESKRKILPVDTQAALEKMILITQESTGAFEAETNALALKNDVGFYEASEEKKVVTLVYQKAAKEFLDRKEEFIILKGPIMEELINMQEKLGRSAKINMMLLDPIKRHPKKS